MKVNLLQAVVLNDVDSVKEILDHKKFSINFTDNHNFAGNYIFQKKIHNIIDLFGNIFLFIPYFSNSSCCC